MITKVCSKCKEEKSVGRFYKIKDGKFGVRGDCKACCRLVSNEWHKRNPDYFKRYSIEHFRAYRRKVAEETYGDSGVRCPHCDYPFKSTQGMNSHISRRHPDEDLVGNDHCGQCGSLENLIKHGREGKRQYYHCRDCNTKRHKKWRNTERGREKSIQAIKRYEDKNPEKRRAWMVASEAVKAGRLIPQPCEVCGTEPAIKHHEDYSKPLDVNWLCPLHHVQLHRSSP